MLVVLTLKIDLKLGGEELVNFLGNPSKSLSTAFECIFKVDDLGSI